MTPERGCSVVRDGARVELRSPHFRFRLDTSRGLRAVSWSNLLTGAEISLGNGAELNVGIDGSYQRIPIVGWKAVRSQYGPVEPDREHGYSVKAFLPEHDDSTWESRVTPIPKYDPQTPPFQDYTWARTHVFLPESTADQPISLILGSNGIYDYRFARVFVNGHEAGIGRFDTRWHEPHTFDLGAVRQHLRFGQDNIIAVQLSGLVTRTRRLDDLDPQQTRLITHKFNWPMQYEQYLVIGSRPAQPAWRTTAWQPVREGSSGEVIFSLRSRRPSLTATISYRWDVREPVLRKTVTVENGGRSPVRLLTLDLGRYDTRLEVSEGEQGFPVYVDGQVFAALAHPAGWVTGQDGVVLLRQHPGRTLLPGESVASMEAVLGASPHGQARPAFLQHVKQRMRRTVRGHARAYAIFDCFASWPDQDYWSGTEAFFLEQIRNVVAPEKAIGCDYDTYCVELWLDRTADLERADPKRFPEGFININRELQKSGIGLGLWCDSSWWEWSIGRNPVTGPCLSQDGSYGAGGDLAGMCRATEPLRSMYSTAFVHHIRENAMQLVKFDNLLPICYNPRHEHLPGIYSTEAIMDAVIETLQTLDRECPDLFIMLYWGHHSPWWLLWGDTLFEPGLQIEASSPAAAPALYVRDSVTVGLDQAQWYAEDIPPLGKDSLGVWLSSWPWNSGIGKERWQEGFVMDMCRGSLLAQPWSDDGCLSSAEREQLATFIQLLKARADCFGNPRFLYGNPWRGEPYGFLCSNGERAFIAINNCSWEDHTFALQCNAKWGLPEGERWDLYRWYPKPRRLLSPTAAAGGTTAASLALRPHEVVLLEIVPAGCAPSLGREFDSEPLAGTFAEPSRALPVQARPAADVLETPLERQAGALPPRRTLAAQCEVPASSVGGVLVIAAELRRFDAAAMVGDVGSHFAAQASAAGRQAVTTPIVPQRTYAAPWQGWRVEVAPSPSPQAVTLAVTALLENDIELVWQAHFVPGSE